jgi:prevent-host-death family protein
MITVSMRELNHKTSQLIHQVRETGSEIQVTLYGKVVARIIPVSPTPGRTGNAWDDLDRLAEEIGKKWPKGVSATQAVSEVRR